MTPEEWDKVHARIAAIAQRPDIEEVLDTMARSLIDGLGPALKRWDGPRQRSARWVPAFEPRELSREEELRIARLRYENGAG